MKNPPWKVEYTDEFGEWFEQLDEDEQESIAASVKLLQFFGPSLSRPYADTLKGSSMKNLKELRTQHDGRPFRTLFAFDPRRHAILLIGGDKTGDRRFYDKMIPRAEKPYRGHLEEIAREFKQIDRKDGKTDG